MAIISFVLRDYLQRLNNNQNTTALNTIARPQRAKLKQVGPDSPGREFIFPFGPQDIEFGDLGLGYDTTKRPGGKAILTAVNQNLRTVSVDAILGDKNTSGKTSIEGMISTFVRMSEEPHDCAFTYGVITLPFRVRITNLSYTAVRRDPDGNITQAEMSFELTEHVEISQSIVTLTAITYDPPSNPPSSSKGSSINPPSSGSGTPSTKSPYYVPSDGSLPRNP